MYKTQASEMSMVPYGLAKQMLDGLIKNSDMLSMERAIALFTERYDLHLEPKKV